MPALRQFKQRGARIATGDPAYLFETAVFVAFPLDGEDRAPDLRQFVFDVPGTEGGMQPAIIPAEEDAARIDVMAREALLEVGAGEGIARGANAGNRDVFDEDVRGHHDDAADSLRKACGVQQCDRAAVAMAEQPGAFDTQRVEEGREGFPRLAMQVVGLQRFFLRARGGAAVAVAGKDQAGQVVGGAEALRKIAPHRNRTQAFVQEDHQRPVRRLRRAHPRVLKIYAACVPADADGLRLRGLATHRCSCLSCGLLVMAGAGMLSQGSDARWTGGVNHR